MGKFKAIWNNPRYNALIRLGLWFIFFTFVIIFIRVSPKEESKTKNEVTKQITYTDIKKEFINSSVMLTIDNGIYYVNGVIKDGTFTGTIQDENTVNKVYYDGVMYLVDKGEKTETDLYSEFNDKLILPKDIISVIDNYNGLLKTSENEKSYTYDINDGKYVIYVKDEKICKVTYEKDNLVYTLEYNYL